ncbi:MAG: hypothetical protein WD738_17945 [Pirellulales bacterium]
MTSPQQDHFRVGRIHDRNQHADSIDPPLEIPDPIEEPSDLDDFDIPCTDDDERRWDVFIPDDDERDPLPDRGDFWGSPEHGARSDESD